MHTVVKLSKPLQSHSQDFSWGGLRLGLCPSSFRGVQGHAPLRKFEKLEENGAISLNLAMVMDA